LDLPNKKKKSQSLVKLDKSDINHLGKGSMPGSIERKKKDAIINSQKFGMAKAQLL
jgi:hypothetical protein